MAEKKKVKIVAVLDAEIEKDDPLFEQMKTAFDGSNPHIRLVELVGSNPAEIIDSPWVLDHLELAVVFVKD
jgi:hypothetical protein